MEEDVDVDFSEAFPESSILARSILKKTSRSVFKISLKFKPLQCCSV